MAKQKTTPAAATIAALTYAEVTALSQSARVERFAVEAMASQRAFSAMGKLFRAIESALSKKDKGIYPLLIGAGIKKGTVSNASYAAKVFDLVDRDLLTEAEFDSLSFNDCFQIVRVQGPMSKRKLTADEVVAAVRSGTHFAEDLSSLFEHGVTAKEKEAADKAAEKAKKAADKEAAEKAEAEKAELEELRKRNEELKAAADKAAADKPEPQTDETPDTPTGDTGDEDQDEAPEPDDDDEAVHDEPAETPAAPAKTEAAPVAPAITAKMLLDLLDEIEGSMTALSPEEQAIVGTRIVEMADAFVATGATANPSAVKEPGKPSKAAQKKAKAVAAK